jgi:hypothetical protein
VYSAAKQYGTNSAQYKKQLGYLLADAQKQFGEAAIKGLGSVTSGGNSLAYVKWMTTTLDQKAQNQAAVQQSGATLAHNEALQKLWLNAVHGGDLKTTNQTISLDRSQIAKLKFDGGSLEHIKGVEDQLKQQLEHQKILEDDIKNVSKTSDVKSLSTTIVGALKQSDQASNSLLTQILQTLRIINQNGTPLNSPGGQVPGTSSRNTNGAG